MARPKKFDITDALDRAMGVFWAQGYAATSLDDLTAAMGISRSSLYDTFGSKRDLFLATITHHNTAVLPDQLARLGPSGHLIKQAIRAFFNDIVDDIHAGGNSTAGFLTKMACEAAPTDSTATHHIAAGLKLVEDAFLRTIAAGQETGEIDPWRDPRALARHLTTSLNGLTVMGRMEPEPEALDDVVDLALSALN
jgi:TetR/AcrR family transcriptional repressor of nem operon